MLFSYRMLSWWWDVTLICYVLIGEHILWTVSRGFAARYHFSRMFDPPVLLPFSTLMLLYPFGCLPDSQVSYDRSPLSFFYPLNSTPTCAQCLSRNVAAK